MLRFSVSKFDDSTNSDAMEFNLSVQEETDDELVDTDAIGRAVGRLLAALAPDVCRLESIIAEAIIYVNEQTRELGIVSPEAVFKATQAMVEGSYGIQRTWAALDARLEVE